jgi:DNA-binding PadR family transcriptional regulator
MGHLSDFEQLLLLSILRVDDAYGETIRRDLAKTAGRRASVASIYVALTRMEEAGLVQSWMSEPTGIRGGRSKRCYRVKPAGVRALQETRARFDRMWAGVDPALHPKGRS